jgi:hypothetical protein
VVDKGVLTVLQDFLRVLWFSSLRIIPSVPHTLILLLPTSYKLIAIVPDVLTYAFCNALAYIPS